MPVFISWSGDRSRHVASALSSLIERTIPDARAWMSQQSIHPGARWEDTLRRVLNTSQYGVLCLTPENLNAPWLLFEAGSIAKNVEKAHVVPYLLGVTPADLDAPLGLFQSVDADEEGTWRLLRDVSLTLPEPIAEAQLRTAFAAAWPDFDRHVAPIRDAASSASFRELERSRAQTEAFAARVHGAWLEHIEGDGVGLFNIRRDARYNSVRVDDGFFYDEKGQFVAQFRSAVARIDEQHGKEGIVYLRECHRDDRDDQTWFHGYGDMWFTGSQGEPYEWGDGRFCDGDVSDPRKTIAKRVELRRLANAEEIRIVERGTKAERSALAAATLKRLAELKG